VQSEWVSVARIGGLDLSDSNEFLKLILDSITEHIVVLDTDAQIRYVNRSWVEFGQDNDYPLGDPWGTVNYLDICDRSAASGDKLAHKAAQGIRQVIRSEVDAFYLEYPCHSKVEKRWFTMRVNPFEIGSSHFYVISHQNITERKLAEEKVLKQSLVDGLTQIPNRRQFDEFLNREWRRCTRVKLPVTLVLIDIDHFKLFNDTYGHQAGDECLQKIGAVLLSFAKRPGDLCARYGGEEFSIVFGNTNAGESLKIVKKVLDAIRGLKIPHMNSPTLPIVTASAGLKTVIPGSRDNEKSLIEAADLLLYKAKNGGRNQIMAESDPIESGKKFTNNDGKQVPHN
jgi:diguanylate cyclase (GGDEF)-like protein